MSINNVKYTSSFGRLGTVKKTDSNRIIFTDLFSDGGSEFPWNLIKQWNEWRLGYQGVDFDFIYATHEMMHFFEEKINALFVKNILKDEDFVYSAIAFCNIYEGVAFILKKYEIKMDLDLKQTVYDNIFLGSDMGAKEYKRIDIEKDKMEILKQLSILYKNEKGNSNEETGFLILKRIRNKLVHPNSKKYQTIHIMGTNKKNNEYFKFIGSFANQEGEAYRCNRRMFLQALKELHSYCSNNMNTWSEKIKKFIYCELDKRPSLFPSEEVILNYLEQLSKHNSEERNEVFSHLRHDEDDLGSYYNIYKMDKEKYLNLKKYLVILVKLRCMMCEVNNASFEGSIANYMSLFDKSCEVLEGLSLTKMQKREALEDIRLIERQRNICLDYPVVYKFIEENCLKSGGFLYVERLYELLAREIDWKDKYDNTRKELELCSKLCAEDRAKKEYAEVIRDCI